MSRSGPRILSILAISLLTVAVAACGPTGALGTVPPAPRTPAPSVDPGPPDLTPAPSNSPTPSPTPGSTPSSAPAVTPTPTPASADTMVIRAYYVLDGEVGVEGLVPTLWEVPETTGVARSAMETLLRGEILADYDDLSTAIPAGTRLLGLSIRDGIATVDLSREFESGGGSASAFRRLGQVVYTLTQFSTVQAVLFQVEGRTVTTFGSEGIILDGPQTRRDYEDILPSIFVDRPAFGAAIGNPARVTGGANVFEATFRIAILDGSGRTVVDQQAMATCGTGCHGTFDVTIRYDVPKAQWGTLRVYYGSAKDGSPQDIRDYPVWLTPAD
jgi:Sporulation and spore germination/Immunoglobulin-like domain of bacterial spore germination